MTVLLSISNTDPLLIDRLWAMGATGVEEQSEQIIVGFDDDSSARHAAAILESELDWSIRPAPPLESWDSYASVTSDGQFLIRPPWLNAMPSSDQIELLIDPGPTFGHGGHPTTRLALRALRKHVQPGDSVLDVGTGSGVLAIAAARLGASRVVALDIDPQAVATAISNAQRNQVEIQVSDDYLANVVGRFDVVVANMERPALLEVVHDLTRLTHRDLLVTGMLSDQTVPGTEGTRSTLDGWALLASSTIPRPAVEFREQKPDQLRRR
ncbi:MAG: 50S ribosomal protein L11 methyltransferase [Acidimicrobiales bacterium]